MLDSVDPFPMVVWVSEILAGASKKPEADTATATFLATANYLFFQL